ncbi:MAG: MBL fold metallo-hydrolase [Paludibacteraceae bacterium]
MKLYKIEAGTFIADGGAMFGVVPKKAWVKRYPCDEENFCTLAMRCMLADTGDKLILVDTGVGNKHMDKTKYYRMQDTVDFEIELNKLGYTCEDVTDVVLTHLHFDHCGGCTYFDTDGELALTFPNAVHWVGKTQWENFIHPNVREGESYFRENMIPVENAGKLKLISEDQWLCPEVELRIYDGHTNGQISPYFHSNGKTLVYAGDVIPVLASIPIAWVSSYDTYPITSMEEKERMLGEAVEKNQILFFEHDNYSECCSVHLVNGRYKLNEVLKLEKVNF